MKGPSVGLFEPLSVCAGVGVRGGSWVYGPGPPCLGRLSSRVEHISHYNLFLDLLVAMVAGTRHKGPQVEDEQSAAGAPGSQRYLVTGASHGGHRAGTSLSHQHGDYHTLG